MAGFYVPNVQDLPLGFEMLARRYATDDILLGRAAGGATGVLSGLEVAADASPAMVVNIDSGLCAVNFVPSSPIADDQLVIPAADPIDPRLDFIVADAADVLWVRSGVADQSPVPTFDEGDVALAMLLVPAGETAITDDHIVDKRVFIPTPLVPTPWATVKADTDDTTTFVNHGTLQDDPVLQFSMLANTKYSIRAELWLDVAFNNIVVPQGGGWRFSIAGPASPTGIRYLGSWQWCYDITMTSAGRTDSPLYLWYPGTSAMATQNYIFNQQVPTSGGGKVWVYFTGEVHNGANAGTFRLQLCQQTALASQRMTRLAGSYLDYLEV